MSISIIFYIKCVDCNDEWSYNEHSHPLSERAMTLVDALKNHIQELKDLERDCTRLGQMEKYSGLCFARLQLETLLESHGHARPASIIGAV